MFIPRLKDMNKALIRKKEFVIIIYTVPLKKFATTAKRQTPSMALGGFSAAGRLEPSVASRQTPGGVGG